MRSTISTSSDRSRPGFHVAWLITSLVLSLVYPGVAHAQDGDAQDSGIQEDGASESDPDRPWFQGTDFEQRKAARELFREGNHLLRIPSFARAAEKYKEAIAIWEHPAFYYNLVIAQLSLVQPIEAYESVMNALRYGAEPMGDEKYQQALNYKERLEAQLTKIVIRCDEPDAEVTLDGRVVFIGPGSHEEVLLPGSHQVMARKEERIPETRQVTLSAGETVEITLILGIPDRVETVRHMPGWIPWASLGVGALLLGGGGYLDWHSSEELNRFDEDFNALCRRGCLETEVPELNSRLEGAESEKRVALSLYIAGGAVFVGSAILVYINRERIVRTKVERRAISWTPMLAPDSAGLSAIMRF